MNRAQRWMLVVGLFVILAASGVATVPMDGCGMPVSAVFQQFEVFEGEGRYGGPVIAERGANVSGDRRPTLCARRAGHRLQIGALVAALGVIGASGGALILREPKEQ